MLGLLAALILANIDYNTLLRLWKLYVPLCLLLVLLTFTSLGVEEGGNRAWLAIRLAGRTLSIQPSEFLKISFITTFALHLSKVAEHLNEPLHVLLLCLHGGIHVLLIQLQDSGTAVIFFIMFLAMIFCAGLAWKYIIAAAAAMMAGLPFWYCLIPSWTRIRFFSRCAVPPLFPPVGCRGRGFFLAAMCRCPRPTTTSSSPLSGSREVLWPALESSLC